MRYRVKRAVGDAVDAAVASRGVAARARVDRRARSQPGVPARGVGVGCLRSVRFFV